MYEMYEMCEMCEMCVNATTSPAARPNGRAPVTGRLASPKVRSAREMYEMCENATTNPTARTNGFGDRGQESGNK